MPEMTRTPDPLPAVQRKRSPFLVQAIADYFMVFECIPLNETGQSVKFGTIAYTRVREDAAVFAGAFNLLEAVEAALPYLDLAWPPEGSVSERERILGRIRAAVRRSRGHE